MPGTSFQNGHRLSGLKTQLGATTPYLDLSYCDLDHCPGGTPDPAFTHYTARGLLKGVWDKGHQTTGDVLSNKARFSYDLGRLVGATVYYPAVETPLVYTYNEFGNMTSKEGVTYTYGNPAKPHQATQVGSSSLGYDADGNLTAGREGQQYFPDKDDRLHHLVANGTTVSFLYDYSGQRVAKSVGTSVTRYYSGLAEVTDTYLTKYHYVGGMLAASQRLSAPGQLAWLPRAPAVQLAGQPGRIPVLIVGVREDVQRGFLLAVVPAAWSQSLNCRPASPLL